MEDTAVIVGAARTAIGKYGGALSPLRAVELGGAAIRAATERSEVSPADIDEVIFGQVLQAGEGQITSRQAAVNGGLPMTVPSLTVNKVCLSGLAAVGLAARSVRLGDASFVMAGGMESMSNAPHVLRELRWGARIGDATMVDVMNHDGLFCAFDHCTMGESSDHKNESLGISRLEQDEWSARSHELAQAAIESGAFDRGSWRSTSPSGRETQSSSTPTRASGPATTPETLAQPPSGVRARRHHHRGQRLTDLRQRRGGDRGRPEGGRGQRIADARRRSSPTGRSAGLDATLHERPAEALRVALKKAGLETSDLDLVEINEAFAAVALSPRRACSTSPLTRSTYGAGRSHSGIR